MDFVIPGTSGPRLTAKRTFMGNVEIYADGIKVPRRGRFRSRWPITASDGRTYELRSTGGLTTTKVEVDEHEIVLERKLAIWETGLVLLPFALIVIGGLIGGLIGGATAEVNRRLARSGLRTPTRIVAMLLATLAGAGLWVATSVGLGILLAPVPVYATGSCYGGFDDGSDPIDLALTEVDCGNAHDAEVVGDFDLSDGAYPGADTLVEWGEAECPRLAERYVGAPLEQTDLSMTVGYPDQSLWSRGDRTVVCFVLSEQDEHLIGSLRGARQ